MAVFFSGDEILKMAVQTEEWGFQFYRKAASLVGSPGSRDLFLFLAKEELSHKGIFSRLENVIAEPSKSHPLDWSDLGSYIKAITDSSLFLGRKSEIESIKQGTDEKEIIKKAIEFEKDTLLFFYQMRDIIKTKERPVLNRIISEEKKHIQKLVQMNNR
jgi:rubrerythrin